jgi:hypothetical protein
VDAIRFMASHGAVRDSLWPNDALSSRYASLPEVKADYPRHLVLGTIADLGASGDIFAETVTCVLLGCPVVVCYDWWGHCVLAVDVALEGGVWYLVCRNSWGMTFGDQGFFKLPEGRGPNRGTPDDAQVVLLLRQLPPTATSAIGSEGASLRPLRKTEVPESAEVSGGCADGSCPAGSRPSWTVGGYRRGHAKPKLDRPSPLPGLPRSL